MPPTRPVLARRLRGFGQSIFGEMTGRANELGAVNLSQGFPDFPGPRFVLDAAKDAIDAGHNQYAPMTGDPVLREAVVETVAPRTRLDYDAQTEVCVFDGATEALHCAFQAFVEPGDDVVMLEPYYDAYVGDCSVAGGTPKFVTLHAPDFKWTDGALDAAFSDRTRMLVLNTPHNPTGRVLDRAELEALAEKCRQHDVICVTDEVYDRLVFDAEHVSMATLPGMRERTVTINSTAKTFSLTGWKIGYATGPAEHIAAMAQAHQFVAFSVARPLQHAMAAALRAPDSYFDTLRAEYRERRDHLLETLDGCGLGVRAPHGTYFIMADIRPLGWDDDIAFCKHLVEDVGVAAIPPSGFYRNQEAGRFLVRFAFCKTLDTLRAARDRLAHLKARPS